MLVLYTRVMLVYVYTLRLQLTLSDITAAYNFKNDPRVAAGTVTERQVRSAVSHLNMYDTTRSV
jgi:hypothetical protein